MLQNNSKIQQAKIDKSLSEDRYKEVQEQIKLQVINAYYTLKASAEAISSAEKQLKSAKKAFFIV